MAAAIAVLIALAAAAPCSGARLNPGVGGGGAVLGPYALIPPYRTGSVGIQYTPEWGDIWDEDFGDGAAQFLLGKDLLQRINSPEIGSPDHAPLEQVTVEIRHMPTRFSNEKLAKILDRAGFPAVFVNLGYHPKDGEGCRSMAVVIFPRQRVADDFMQWDFRRHCGSCPCRSGLVREQIAGLAQQVKIASDRLRIAPIIRGMSGDWHLLPRGARAVAQAELDEPEKPGFTTVVVEGLPTKWYNTHMLKWMLKLEKSGFKADFARIYPKTRMRGKTECATKVVINFQTHREAEKFLERERVRSKSTSVCGKCKKSGGKCDITWNDPDRQGLNVLLSKVNVDGVPLIRAASGVWELLQVDPFAEKADDVVKTRSCAGLC